MKQIFASFAIALSIVASPDAGAANAGAPVVVIGDSLNDTGAFAASTVTGRFTNTPGLLWTEIVAHSLGGRADPAQIHDGENFVFVGGTNWAQSGALAARDGGLYNGLSQSVTTQVDAALERQIGSGTVVLMDGGGPDVLGAVFGVAQKQMTPEQAFAAVAGAGVAMADEAKRIEDAGARVVLLNVGNFGVFPLMTGLGDEVATLAEQLSLAFNQANADRANEIGLKAVRPDVFAWTMNVTSDPATYGLTNVRDPGCDLARVTETPTRAAANCTLSEQVSLDAANTHLFSDDIHGSAASHRLLADYVLEHLQIAGRLAERD